ncbi:MAG: PASTA domain-containing protein [Deinococcota bacterium]
MGDGIGRNSRRTLGREARERVTKYQRLYDERREQLQRYNAKLAAILAGFRFLIAAGLLAGLGWMAFVQTRDYLVVPTLNVPDVTGLAHVQAEETLRAAGLTVVTYADDMANTPVNHVTMQTPNPGTMVRIGRSVTIGINTPADDVPLPELFGLDLNQATERLQDLGFELGKVSYDFSDQPARTVIAQEPAATIPTRTGSNVDVILSRGAPVAQITMPDLRGITTDQARSRLAGLGIRSVSTVAGGVGYSGGYSVISQRPQAGQTVLASVPVTLYYSIPGDNLVRVPNLTGLSLREAEQQIRDAGLTVGWLDYLDLPDQAGGVYDWQPRGYTLAGTTLVVRVNGTATGDNTLAPPEPSEDEPPLWLQPGFDAFFGQPTSSDDLTSTGTSTLTDDSSSTDVTTNITTDASPIPTITPTTSAATPATPTLPLATPAADAANARNITIRFNPDNYGFLQSQENMFQLIVNDDRGEREVISRLLQDGDTIDTVITVYGRAELRTYINNNLFQAWNP